MRRGFTLVEMIFVLIVTAILAAGTFKATEALYIRTAKTKALTDLSLQTQIVLDQLSILLYNRIPNSVIGYSPGGACEPIDELTDSRPVLEWLGMDDDALLNREYDGFVDMNASVKATYTLSTPGNTLTDATDRNLIFAGALDAGAQEVSPCAGAFGWHGNDSNLSYGIAMSVDAVTITDANKKPDFIYEKYYLTNTAYAVARGQDIDLSASCITDLGLFVNDDTLFLFYDYQPYSGDTFCADSGTKGVKSGNVTILSYDVKAFNARAVNDVIRLSLESERVIRGASNDVRVSKQKGVF